MTAPSRPDAPPAAPASPPARRLGRPRWLDARLVVGVVLVLLSVVVGARVVSAASQTVPTWAAARPLAAGTVVQEQDVRLLDVRLDDVSTGAYLGAADPPTGRVLDRGLAQGELVPAAAVMPPGSTPLRRVAVPVDSLHTAAEAAALLDRRVDLFATSDEDGTPVTRAVLRGATVVDVRAGGGGDLAVVVLVPPAVAPELVAALRAAALDVVVVQGEGEEVPEGAVRYDPLGGGAPLAGPPAPAEDGVGPAGPPAGSDGPGVVDEGAGPDEEAGPDEDGGVDEDELLGGTGDGAGAGSP